MVDNAEQGLAKACAATGAQITDYSAAPVLWMPMPNAVISG